MEEYRIMEGGRGAEAFFYVDVWNDERATSTPIGA